MNLASLADQGLSRTVMQASYNELAQAGIPPDWLDIRFEIETLARYLPSEVALLQLPGADGEAAAA